MGTNSVGEIIEEDDDDSEKSRDSTVESPTSPTDSEAPTESKPANDGWTEWTPDEEEEAKVNVTKILSNFF